MSGINSFSDYSSNIIVILIIQRYLEQHLIHQWEQLIIYQIMLQSEMEAIRN